MRVLIAGAGPAGLTLAYWLEKAGHTATIVEKSPSIRTEGYMIDFTGTGWDVAARMGIIPSIRQRGYPMDSVIYKDAHDNITAKIGVGELLRSMDQPNYAALDRRDLVLTLYEAVEDKVEICFGKSIEAVTQDDHAVHVSFNDNRSEDYDILVGCDGIHSHTRQLIFGDEIQFAKQLGYQFAISEIEPLQHDLGASYHMHVEPNVQLGLYPTTANKWLIFAAFANSDDRIPPQHERVQALKQHIGHLQWYVPEILEKLNQADTIFWDNIEQIQMPQWYKNRVALIGDAAYCPTLVSGQGASMAMAGAYFLAEALAQTDKPQAAFQMVDTRLRPHIDKIQKSAQNFAPTFIPKSQFRITLVNWALRLSGLPMFKGLISKQFTVNSIL